MNSFNRRPSTAAIARIVAHYPDYVGSGDAVGFWEGIEKSQRLGTSL